MSFTARRISKKRKNTSQSLSLLTSYPINSWALPARPQNVQFYIVVDLYEFVPVLRSFTESDLSDTGNIVPFENTTPINLINLLCVLLFDLFFDRSE